MSDILIRDPQASDGLARYWLDAGVYYAAVNPDLFQIPEAEQ